jgi:Family of unknown function (DUF6312)
MDRIVNRITVVHRNDGEASSTTVYRRKKKRRKTTWSGPLERAARDMLKAQQAFAQSALDRQDRSNRRRREGWLVDGPVNLYEAGRRAYNQGRKAIPFRMLPRM